MSAPPPVTGADRRGSPLPVVVGRVGKREAESCFMAERSRLHAAKIMTVGERAEDVVYLTDFRQPPLKRPRRRRASARSPCAGIGRAPGGAAGKSKRRARRAHESASRCPCTPIPRAPGTSQGEPKTPRPARLPTSACRIGEPQHTRLAFGWRCCGVHLDRLELSTATAACRAAQPRARLAHAALR